MGNGQTAVNKPAGKRIGNIKAEVTWKCDECGEPVDDPTYINGVAVVHCRKCNGLKAAVK